MTRSAERIAIAVVSVLACGSGAAGDTARGRRIVFDPAAGDCTICHVTRDGDRTNQGTIGPPLIDLALRYDAAGKALLTAGEIDDVVAYLLDRAR